MEIMSSWGRQMIYRVRTIKKVENEDVCSTKMQSFLTTKWGHFQERSWKCPGSVPFDKSEIKKLVNSIESIYLQQ